MLSNYYTLAMLAAGLDTRLRGTAIREAYTQEKNELVVSFEEMSDALVISCAADVNTLYLHPTFSRARTNSTDALSAIHGKTILSVSIQPMDRVIAFQLAEALSVHAQFFGAKANVLVVNAESEIVDAFKNARSITDSRYEPRDGEIVQEVAALRTLIAQEPTETLFALLKRTAPSLGSTLATEILFRSSLSPTSRASEMNDESIGRLEGSFQSVVTELAQPTPRVYVGKDPPRVPHRFSLVHLEHCKNFEERRFVDVHEGVRFFISRVRSVTTLQSYAGNILAMLQRHRTKLQRTITAVEEDLGGPSRADEYERYATLLMSNPGFEEKVVKSITISENGEVVVIPVDSRLSLIRNAQRYFEKAKRSKLAYDRSRKRLAELRAALAAAQKLLALAESIHTKDELKQFKIERAAELERFGIGKKAQEREQLPFRIFSVEGGFEVWAGKSSRNNDELTMKHAKPNDLWFHARGASGSHVVLKTNTGNGEPGKKAKEQAAGIAAYYSKMKNAKMVPVAMTERKYVRKPKGSPPGTVVLEREKVIFAEPALPQQEP